MRFCSRLRREERDNEILLREDTDTPVQLGLPGFDSQRKISSTETK